LLLALVCPWFFVRKQLDEVTGSNNSTFQPEVLKVRLYWWNGFMEWNRNGSSKASTQQDWSDISGDQPERVYLESMGLLCLGFLLVLLEFVCESLIVLGSWKRMVITRKMKYITIGIAVLGCICVVLAWALFIRFPDALNEAKLCASAGTSLAWCDTFIGFQNVNINGGRAGLYVWCPFVGWVCALLSTVPLVVVGVVSFWLRAGQRQSAGMIPPAYHAI